MIRMNRTRQLIAIVLIVIIIGSIVSGVLIINTATEESSEGTARIYGTVYDEYSMIGIANELAVVLDADGDSKVLWPDDPENPGYYEFVDVEPGWYSLYLGRSWAKVDLFESDYEYLKGGWIFPEIESLQIKAGDVIHRDFYLDFYTYFSDSVSCDNLRLRGSNSQVFLYADRAILWDDRNLIGKVMDFSISWENSFLTRIDCAIEVLDQYSSNDEHFEPGVHTETLSFTIDEDFVSETRNREQFYWDITVESLPSVEVQDIEIQVNWTITNPE